MGGRRRLPPGIRRRGAVYTYSVRQSIAVLRSCLKAAQIDGHLDTLPLLG